MKNSFQENFKAAYAKLNTQQRLAVDTIYGPVMVIAGPGTGKTQILATRICNILDKTDALYTNILCLTYTDAGAVNMRKRLIEMIGANAQQISIMTFHAFCNQVISEQRDYFGYTDLEPLTELEQTEIIREIIDEIPADNILKRLKGDVYNDASNLIRLFETMKSEGWTKELIQSKSRQYLEALHLDDNFYYKRNGANFKKGEFKQKEFDTIKEKLDRTLSATELMQNYSAKLLLRKRYSYGDMITWVNQLFEERDDIRLSYCERFQYILVDEYQDTSGSQNNILFHLTDYEQPNVFVVGDDDQSIFRFQGANIENIHGFESRFADENLTKIVLNENYRSTQSVLNASMRLIQNNVKRAVANEEKILVSRNETYTSIEIQPEVIACNSVLEESAFIAREIIDLVKNKNVEPNEIAVLYRKHQYAESLIKVLRQHAIPISLRKNVNILEEKFIRNFLNLLKYISAEMQDPHSGEQYLFELLHSPYFGIDALEIASFSVQAFKYKKQWRVAANDIKIEQNTLFETKKNNLYATFKKLEKWLKLTVEMPLQRLIETIINDSTILQYSIQREERFYLLQLLQTFFDFVKAETHANPTLSLHQLLEKITLMENFEIKLEMNTITGSLNGVQFATIHGSKGLEYEYVYMMRCDDKAWKEQANRGFYMPPTLFQHSDSVYASSVSKSDDKTDKSLEDLEESRRLFYVGMTRAKHHLVFTYPTSDDKKELTANSFLNEILEYDDVKKREVNLSEDELVRFMELQMQSLADKAITLIDQYYLEPILENYKLSVTHLNNYLHCPLNFYFMNLLRIPSGKNASTAYGSAVHEVLDVLFKKYKDQKSVPTESDILHAFDKALSHQREFFSDVEFKNMQDYGYKTLPDYIKQRAKVWQTNSLSERNMDGVTLRGTPIKGVFDRIDFIPNSMDEIQIVDFKTGKYDNAKKKLIPPKSEEEAKTDEELIGGDYWRQALFYKVLTDSSKLTWKAKSAVFDFVEPKKLNETPLQYPMEIVEFSPSDIQFVTKQIDETYIKIRNYEFDKGCGKPDCYWCSFANEYLMK